MQSIPPSVMHFTLYIGLLLYPSLCFSAPNDWAEGSAGLHDGATRDYFNRGAQLRWTHFMGDWVDASGKQQGNKAYADAVILDTDTIQLIQWDVSSLVHMWHTGQALNQGFLLRLYKKGGPTVFASRENSVPAHRPKLILKTASKTYTLSPVADTYIARSTYQSQGHKTTIRASKNNQHILIRFDLRSIPSTARIQSAFLQLTTTQQYGGTTTIGVFRSRHGEPLASSSPRMGVASQYTEDTGITQHPDVLFAERFETTNWKANWTRVSGDLGVTSSDPARAFQPLLGKALWSRIAKGKLSALSMLYEFKKEGISEPEEIYFRYYLRLSSNWNQTVQGGKLPGIVGTYDKAGWGGRKSDGTNGWSARGSFGLTIPKGNPLAGHTPIGNYVYHTDQKTTYGDVWIWTKGYKGYIPTKRWICIEQYVKLNTPSNANGVLRTWVDGQLAFEKKDIRYRTTAKLKIQRIWFNLYHGGKTASPYDQHIFIDHVVIARQYIGPLKRRPMPQPDAPPREAPSEYTVDAGTPSDSTFEPQPELDKREQKPTTDTQPDVRSADTQPTETVKNFKDQEINNEQDHISDTHTGPSEHTTQVDSPNGPAQTGCGCVSSQIPSIWLTFFILLFCLKRRHRT